jgi:hypothetical protein
MSVGAAAVVEDLRHFLLPDFLAFGVLLVISFRLLNSVFTLLIRPVFAGGTGCLLVLNRPVFVGGSGCLLILNRPVFAGCAGCLLVVNMLGLLFGWLLTLSSIYL